MRERRQGGDRQGEVEAGGAAQRVGVPGVVGAGGQHARRSGGGGDPHAGPHVAHRPRVLEQDQRLRPRLGEHRRQVDLRPAGDRDDAGARRLRRQLGHDLGGDGGGPLGQRAAQVRGQLGRQRPQLLRVGGDRLEHLGAEAQRVLEGMEALEDGEARVAPRRAVAADQRALVGIAQCRSSRSAPGAKSRRCTLGRSALTAAS